MSPLQELSADQAVPGFAGAISRRAVTKVSISSRLPIETRSQVGIEGNFLPMRIFLTRKAWMTGVVSPPTSVMKKFVSEGMTRLPSFSSSPQIQRRMSLNCLVPAADPRPRPFSE